MLGKRGSRWEFMREGSKTTSGGASRGGNLFRNAPWGESHKSFISRSGGDRKMWVSHWC